MYALDGNPFTTYERGAEIGRWDSLQLLAPATPSKIICVGLNYPAHADEGNREMPPQSGRVDYEAELGFFILALPFYILHVLKFS